MTSGSWRSTLRRAWDQSLVSVPISLWLMIDVLSRCRTSIGSSIVTMFAARSVFMWSTMAASVVVLPDPVGPVTRTSPRCSSARRVTTGGNPRSAAERGLGRTRRRTRPEAPRCRKALQRNRPTPLTDSEKSASPVDLNSSSRSGGSTTRTSSSQSSGLTTGKGVTRRSPFTRARGAEPTLMCKSEAPCSAAWRRTAGKSITAMVSAAVEPSLRPNCVCSHATGVGGRACFARCPARLGRESRLVPPRRAPEPSPSLTNALFRQHYPLG